MNRKIEQKNGEPKNHIQKLVKESSKKENETTQVSSELSTREGAFRINPQSIVLNFEDKNGNPRLDYGDDFPSLKESIKLYGVQQPLKLYKDEEGEWHLAHGYRRMKATLELINEGVIIEQVPFDEVDYDEVQILIEHFTLNTGKPLNDVELAEGLKRLSVLSNDTNVSELARRVGMDYQKAHNLWNFIEKAGTQIKKAVIKGDVSFNVGYIITKKSNNVSEQNTLLKEGIENAKATGTVRVHTKHIPKINNDKMPLDVKIKLKLVEVSKMDGIDIDLIETITKVVDAIKTNQDIALINDLLKIKEKAYQE